MPIERYNNPDPSNPIRQQWAHIGERRMIALGAQPTGTEGDPSQVPRTWRDAPQRSTGVAGLMDSAATSLATVHLVDDDTSFLTAMARFVGATGLRVATYSSGFDLLSRVSPATRGCVVADLSMPGISGLALQSLLAGRGIEMPVVFLTGHGDIPSSVQAMREGAMDFLEKLAPREQLMAAILCALKRDEEAHSLRARLEELRRRFAALSDRERAVLALVVRGKMNKQIAAALGLHERTVKLHRTAITTKLRVRTVAQLTVMASEAGLLRTGSAIDMPADAQEA
jgi:FixJ family two-component response regulator